MLLSDSTTSQRTEDDIWKRCGYCVLVVGWSATTSSVRASFLYKNRLSWKNSSILNWYKLPPPPLHKDCASPSCLLWSAGVAVAAFLIRIPLMEEKEEKKKIFYNTETIVNFIFWSSSCLSRIELWHHSQPPLLPKCFLGTERKARFIS